MAKTKKPIPQAAADALKEFSQDFARIEAARMELLRRKLEETLAKAIEEGRAFYMQQIPEEILNMKFSDFLEMYKKPDNQPNKENDAQMVTPVAKPRGPPGRIELKTPSGTVILPSYITPRVDGTRKMRPSKAGEILFLATGTPVIAAEGSTSTQKNNEAELLKLLKNEEEMSPGTAQIVSQLKQALNKKNKE